METIGSNTPFIVYIIIFGYFISLILFVRFFLSVRTFVTEDQVFYHRVILFSIGSIVLIILLSKASGLGSRLTDLDRIFAITHGWYDDRRTFQMMVSAGIILCGVMGIIILELINCNVWHHYYLTLSGTLFLTCHYLIMIISFHPIDQILYRSIGSIPVNRLIELANIYWIIISLLIDYIRLSNKGLPDRAAAPVSRII